MQISHDSQVAHQINCVAIRASSNWKLIADYISRYPKNERVQRVIKEVVKMKREAALLSGKGVHGKK